MLITLRKMTQEEVEKCVREALEYIFPEEDIKENPTLCGTCYVKCNTVEEYQRVKKWIEDRDKVVIPKQVLVTNLLNCISLKDGKLYPEYVVNEGDRVVSYADFTNIFNKEEKSDIEKHLEIIEKELVIIKNLLKK